MKNILIVSILSIALFSSCLNNLSNEEKLEEGVFKVEVKEVLETTQYTYFKGIVSGAELWFAVGKTNVETGKSYYYKNPLEMQSFKSKELDRTFDYILFLNSIQDNPDFSAQTSTTNAMGNTMGNKKNELVKESELKIEHTNGAISIGELFENKAKYEGKVVTLKGKVVKFNPQIMKTNWIHLQDGTEFDKQFDITVTSDAVVTLGDIITIEGVVTLNKDFGAGYKYDVIVENGQIK